MVQFHLYYHLFQDIGSLAFIAECLLGKDSPQDTVCMCPNKFWSRAACIQIPMTAFTLCVVKGRTLNLLLPHFPDL